MTDNNGDDGTGFVPALRPATTLAPDDPHGFDARIRELGLTPYSFAIEIGQDPQKLYRLIKPTKSGAYPRSAAFKEIVRALEALEKGRLGGRRHTPTRLPGAKFRHSSAKSETTVFSTMIEPDGSVKVAEHAHAYARVPASLDEVSGVIGIIVRDNAMTPVYRPGDTLILNPAGVPQPGSGVALLRAGELILREYVDETPDKWIVRRYGREPAEETILKHAGQRAYVVSALYPGR